MNNKILIDALKKTAERLESNETKYEWGHMGRCNCGHLLQTVSGLSDVEIVKTIDFETDEWSEHAKEYCSGTGGKITDHFLTLKNIGFGWDDVIYLEYLSDKNVLARLGVTHLERNDKDNVARYMRTKAELLEG
ncbi:MAG: hypothetical protein Kapaf2KO_03210 [Candidatus Kapaibacteriales bacterium]